MGQNTLAFPAFRFSLLLKKLWVKTLVPKSAEPPAKSA